MKLRSKLILSFASIASLIVVAGTFGILASRQTSETFGGIIDNSSPQLAALGLLQAAANELSETAIHHAILKQLDRGSGSEEETKFLNAKNQLGILFDDYQQIAEEPELFKEITKGKAALDEATTLLILFSTTGSDNDVIAAQIGSIDAAADQLRTTLDNAIEEETIEFQARLISARNAEELATRIDLFAIVVVVGAALGLGLLLTRQILLPINHLKSVSDRMMSGDYSQRTPIERKDEIGELSLAFNTMAAAIQKRDADLENQIEEAQTARALAERSDQVKSAFLASMSHELRTPLNSVINFTKFVAKGTMGPVNDEQKEALEEAIDSAKHLLSLINDVLDMSKIESGTLKLFMENNIDLQPIIDTVMSTSRILLEDKPVELKAVVDPDLPRIRCDRQRILQILLNVMSNACKFTEKGSITLRVGQQNSEIRFVVTDTGAGIASEDQPDVFQPFKQTEAGLRQAGGTGLGMPISKNLVEAHGGRITLESVPGQGTSFTIAIPLQIPAVSEDTLIMEPLS